MPTISKGNTKLGKIPNISLPPIKSCRPRSLVCKSNCYALKAYRMYPQTRRAWDRNLEEYYAHPIRYFQKIHQWLTQSKTTLFRWHVSGDIPDKRYFIDGIIPTAEQHPNIRFLLFTKRWDILSIEFESLTMPGNLMVILSMWPRLAVPASRLPKAWLSEDKRKPAVHMKCMGKCDECHACWDITNLGFDVVFDRH